MLSVKAAILLFLGTAFCLPGSSPAAPSLDELIKRQTCDGYRDRTFRIFSISNDGLGTLNQRYQAQVERNFDPKKPLSGPEVTGCSVHVIGSGCKWGKIDNSPLGKDYHVNHSPYLSTIVNLVPVQVSGGGCNDQKLECASDIGQLFDPASDRFIYFSTSRCAIKAPPNAKGLTSEEFAIFNNLATQAGWCNGKPCNLVLH